MIIAKGMARIANRGFEFPFILGDAPFGISKFEPDNILPSSANEPRLKLHVLHKIGGRAFKLGNTTDAKVPGALLFLRLVKNALQETRITVMAE
jgi:hypothetical protein